MNMLLNSGRPRFDSHLWSARLRPQPAAGASAPLAPATQQPESWVPSFRFRQLPRRACAAAGCERLGSRSLKAPRQARRPVRVRTCEQLAYFALSCRGIPQTWRAGALSACTARRPRQDDIRGQFGQRARLRRPISRRAADNSHAPQGFWPL